MHRVNSKLAGILLAGVLAAVGLLSGPASAAAAPTRVFEPILSLTGGCETSKLDEVPDPSCPYAPGEPPSGTFTAPAGVATDEYGDIYVASSDQYNGSNQGRIDIFDSSGHFISELKPERPFSPTGISVDSEGYLYAVAGGGVARFDPTTYDPQAGEIEYGTSFTVIESGIRPFQVNPVDGHLFVLHESIGGSSVWEYGSAAEGNPLISESLGAGEIEADNFAWGIALDATRNRLYVPSGTFTYGEPAPTSIKIFELASPHAPIGEIKGTTVPAGEFQPFFTMAVDESTGHIFIFEPEVEKIYEVTENGEFVGTIDHGFKQVFGATPTVDNGRHSPNGGENPAGHFLFVPSHPTGTGHVFAFGPEALHAAPVVTGTAVLHASETDAELKASIEPGGLATHYAFQYVSQQAYEAAGGTFAAAVVAREGDLPAGDQPVTVTAQPDRLVPGTAYRFRVLATNAAGANAAGGDEGAFKTYAESGFISCPNQAFRVGPAAQLPDCRAYELVSPSETNGHIPRGVSFGGMKFPTREASASGDAVSFVIEGGSLPGVEATGSVFGDSYVAKRTPDGWQTEYAGATGAEAVSTTPGSSSLDQGYSFWEAELEGSALVEGHDTSYVHYPDGHSEVVGRGSLGIDPGSIGKYISPGGSHIIFITLTNREGTAEQLEPNAPAGGTGTVYDRTSDGVTHVISLLPGDVTPPVGRDATYLGSSPDGNGVAFQITSLPGAPVFLRYQNRKTCELPAEADFAGIAEGGARVFYLKDGDLYRFDCETGEIRAFTSTGDVTPVNVAASGDVAYFVSPSVITTAPNPLGAVAAVGAENLYMSRDGAVDFVGTVTARDVEGNLEGSSSGVNPTDGLGLWILASTSGHVAADPSRATPDGNVLLFQSRARLTDYDSEGHVEVYRFDAASDELDCLSCNPTGLPAQGAASLQPVARVASDPDPLSPFGIVDGLRADGDRAFFQSDEPLVAGDVDGQRDVYEWEAGGVGSCKAPGGCVALISSGHSAHGEDLYAVSSSGDDVFIRSSELLLPLDREETPSIYDVRVSGGFAEPQASACEGEACHPKSTPPPSLGFAPVQGTSGNVKAPRACPKGKHSVKRRGGKRCVRKHGTRRHRHPAHHHHRHPAHHHRGGNEKGAAK